MAPRPEMVPRSGGQPILSPAQIVEHPLFSDREKIDLLGEMRAHVIARAAVGDDLGFGTDEIDAAIADLKQRIRNGVGNKANIDGPRDGR